MMGDALKPCPLCGGEAQRITLSDEDGPANVGGDVITCVRCGLSSHVEFGRKENLVSAWNTRADDGVIAELVEALKRAHEALDRVPSGTLGKRQEPFHDAAMRRAEATLAKVRGA